MNLLLSSSVICTLIVSYVFVRMSFSYTYKRLDEKYADGKIQAPSIRSFKTLSKLLFVTSMLVTVIGYWYALPFIPVLHESVIVRCIGVVIVITGFICLQRTFIQLGDNYSPLFDAYLPNTLVTDGIYRKIRHPIYLFNLFVSFGLAISSGSLAVIACAVTGFIFVIRAIYIEEAYLLRHFPEFKKYTDHSYRMVPFIF